MPTYRRPRQFDLGSDLGDDPLADPYQNAPLPDYGRSQYGYGGYGGRRSSRRRRPGGFDLLSNDEQEAAVRLGITDPQETDQVVRRQPFEERPDYMDELGVQRPRGMLNQAERQQKAAADALKQERADFAALRQQKTRTTESATFHKKDLKAFDDGPEGLELAQLQAGVQKDTKLAGEKVGFWRGAMTPGVERGDATSEAAAAQGRLSAERERADALAQKRARIEQQAKESESMADAARRDYHAVNDDRLGLTNEGLGRAAGRIDLERLKQGLEPVSRPTVRPPAETDYNADDWVQRRVKKVNDERAAQGRSDFIDPRTMGAYSPETVKKSRDGLDVDPVAIERAAIQNERQTGIRSESPLARALELGKLKASGVTHVGSQPIEKMLERYGGEDSVDSARLAESYNRAKQRLAEINEMLPGMTDRAKQPLYDERDVLDAVLAEKAQQTKERGIWDEVRDPFWFERANAFTLNAAKGAAGALTDTGEFLGRNALRAGEALSTPGVTAARIAGIDIPDGEAQQKVAEFSQAMRQEAEAWNWYMPEQVKKRLEENFVSGDVARGVGSTAAFFGPSVVMSGIGRLAGLGERALSGLLTTTVAGTGAAASGNSFRRQAMEHLRPQLEAGEITVEEFNRAAGLAELSGSVLGATEAVPVSRFARRIGELPAGRTFLSKMLEIAGKGGGKGASAWLKGPGRKMMVDVVSEGIEEGGQEWVQSVLEDVAARQIFDPDREVDWLKAAKNAAVGGFTGLLFSGVTNAMDAPRVAKRYRELGDAVNRGRKSDGDGEGSGPGVTAGPDAPPSSPVGGSRSPVEAPGPMAEVEADDELAQELGRPGRVPQPVAPGNIGSREGRPIGAAEEAMVSDWKAASAKEIPAATIKHVSELNAGEFASWAKALNEKGTDFTNQAHKLGIAAIGDENLIKSLREKQTQAGREAEAAGREGDGQRATTLSVKRQFFSEAISAATNEGSAVDVPEVKAAHAKLISRPPAAVSDQPRAQPATTPAPGPAAGISTVATAPTGAKPGEMLAKPVPQGYASAEEAAYDAEAQRKYDIAEATRKARMDAGLPAPKPKESLPAIIKRLGRQKVRELIGDWNSDADLHPEGAKIMAVIDARNRTNNAPISTKEFMSWMAEHPDGRASEKSASSQLTQGPEGGAGSAPNIDSGNEAAPAPVVTDTPKFEGRKPVMDKDTPGGFKIPAPPASARAPNTPATFVKTVATAAKLRAGSKPHKFLVDFSRRLHRAAPKAFGEMQVKVLTKSEWDADPALKSQTPDSSGAYDPAGNVIFLRADRADPASIANTIVHEAGHFAERFYLGEDFAQGEWEKLTFDQRAEAAKAYYGKSHDGTDLLEDRRARAEWTAMQFARVVRGDTAGMGARLKAKLSAFLKDIRALVNKWIGDGKLTTPQLDAKILEMLGYKEDVTPATPNTREKLQAIQRQRETQPLATRNVSKELAALGDALFGAPVASDINDAYTLAHFYDTAAPTEATARNAEPAATDAQKPEQINSEKSQNDGYTTAHYYGTPSELARRFSPEQVEQANRFVAAIVREQPGVRSRETLAKFIDANFPKARPFSDTIFRLMGGFTELDESGTFEEAYAPAVEPAAVPAVAEVKAPVGATVTETAKGPEITPTPAKESQVSKLADKPQLRAQKEFLGKALKEAGAVAPEQLEMSAEGNRLMESIAPVSGDEASGRTAQAAVEALARQYGFAVNAGRTGQLSLREVVENRIAAEHAQHITIHVPGDGTFSVPHSKQHLANFTAAVEKRFGKTTAGLPAPTTQGRPLYEGRGATSVPAVTKNPNVESLTKAAKLAVSDDPTRKIITHLLRDNASGFSIGTSGRALFAVAGGGGETMAEIFKAEKAKFPNWRQVIPEWVKLDGGKVRAAKNAPVKPLTVDTAEAIKAINQVRGVLTERSNRVVLHNIGSGKIGFSGSAPDVGDYQTEGVRDEGTAMTAANPDYLHDAMTAARLAGHETVQLYVTNDTAPMVVIGGDNFAGIIMPLRTDQPGMVSSSPQAGKDVKVDVLGAPIDTGAILPADENNAARSTQATIRDALNIARAGNGTDSQGQSELLSGPPGLQRSAQEKALTAWAESRGLMRDAAEFIRTWEEKGSLAGAEHQVYFDAATKRMVKRNGLRFHAGDWVPYFNRLLAHNQLFPETAYRFEGFTEEPDSNWQGNIRGSLLAIVSQPFIEGRHATPDEVRAAMSERGFFSGASSLAGRYENDQFIVDDANETNVLMGTDGKVYFIDPAISLKPGIVLGAPTDLTPPKNAAVPGQPGYRYRSHPDTLIERGLDAIRQVYRTQGNEATAKAAKAFLDNVKDDAVAVVAANDQTNAMPGAVRTAVKLLVEQKLSDRWLDTKLTPRERAQAKRQWARLVEAVAERGTDIGQEIQAFDMANRMTPDGVLMAAERAVRQRQERILGEAGRKAVDAVTDAMQAANAELIDEATADMDTALRAVKVGKSIWRRYRDAAGRRWLARIENALRGETTEQPPLMEFTNRLAREVQARIDEALPPGEPKPQRTPAELIREAVENREKYKEAWDAAREELGGQYANQPDVLEKLDDAMLGLLDRPYSDKTLDRAIKEAHREMGLSVQDLARMHYREADALGQSLAEKIAQQAGLKPDDAERLANLVKLRMSKLTAEAKKKALARLIEGKTGGARRVFGAADRIIELSNLGALTAGDYFDAVAGALELPGLSDQQAARMRALAEKAQATPEGFQRDRVLTDLLTELQKIKGVGIVDVATAVYYAHILSGYTTQMVNAVSTALNTAADIAVKVTRHPTTALQALRGIRSGARTGFVQALAILDTGYSHRSFDEKLPEVSPILELLAKDQDRNVALRNYAKLLRYVSRAMKAMDAVFFYSASEAYQRIAAARLAADFESGKLNWRQRGAKVRDLLAMSPDEFEAARQQAKAEGLAGLDYQLRVGEIIRQKRDAGLVEGGVNFGREATFNQEPRGYLGVAAKAIREASNKFPPLRLFVPFTNIVSNVANASLNYSPVGVLRAVRGYGGEAAPQAEERDALLIKGIAGSLGLVWLLAYGMGDGEDDETPWITGIGPKSTPARNQLRKTGWKPHTVKIGDRYVSYLETPLAIPLAIVGNYIDGVKYNGLDQKAAGERLAKAISSVPETIISMSFLRGLADFMDAARGRKNWGDIGASVVAGATMPNLVRQIDRTIDPTFYETDGALGMVAGQIPGVRQTFPTRLDVVGQPIEGSPMERFGRQATGDELWDTLAAKQAWIPEAGKATKLGKERLTPAQYRAYVQQSGTAIEARLRAALPRLKLMTPEQADDFVDKVTREERAKVKPRLRSLVFEVD